MALFWNNPAFGSNSKPQWGETRPVRLRVYHHVYRGKEGYAISGRDGIGRSISIFVHDEPTARKIVKVYKDAAAGAITELERQHKIDSLIRGEPNFAANPEPVVVTVHQVLAGAYAGRGRRGGAQQIDRTMLTHAIVVDQEGNWVEEKTVCRRINADTTLCDLTETRGTLPTCPTCRERVQRRGYVY